MKRVSVALVIATLFSFNILFQVGIENFPNWKFFTSAFGFLGFLLLLVFDIRIRSSKEK